MDKHRLGPQWLVWAKIAFAGFLFIFIVCGRMPIDAGNVHYEIRLSLEEENDIVATYSGKAITAIVDLPDSEVFSQIAWHTGSGSYSSSGFAPGNKMKQVKVSLFWNFIPTLKDSVTKKAYDTLYVSLDGETVRSNIVKVFVTNIPPIIDSLWINTTSLKGADTVCYALSATDTNSRFSIRASAHDVNNDIIHYEWISSRGLQLPQFQTVWYDVPKTQFSDTVYLNCYDGKGGNTTKYIIINKLAHSVPPIIDSLKIGAKTFGNDSLIHTYSARNVDTLKLRVFANDANPKDSLSVTWKHTNPKDSLVRNSSSPMLGTLLCDTMFKDSNALLRIVDTVYAVVKDVSGDSVKTIVRILQGIQNSPPKVDSIRVNAAMQCKGSTVLYKDSASAKDTFLLRIFASDPDSLDSARVTLFCNLSSALSKLSDTTYRYVAKDSLYTDSISCYAKDTHADSVRKTVVISVINRYPIIDSLSVADTLRKSDTLFYPNDSIRTCQISIPASDSVKIRIFGHDPDLAQKDSVTQVQWTLSSAKTMKLLNANGTYVQYPCQSAAETDTVSVKIFDRKQKWTGASMIFKVGTP